MTAHTVASGTAWLLLTAGCAVPETTPAEEVLSHHASAITGLCVARDSVYSCSHSGVFVGEGDHPRPIAALAFRPIRLAARDAGDEVALLVCGGHPAKSGEVARLSRDGAVLAWARVADDLVYDVAVTPDGATVAIACADGRVLLLEPEQLSVDRVSQLHSAPCRAVTFSPDGRTLASAGLDGHVLITDLGGDQPPRVLQDHTAGVECLAFSSDGALLASGSRDGKVRLHDPEGRLMRSYQRLGSPVTAITHAHGSFWIGLRSGAVVRLADDWARVDDRRELGEPVHALLARPEGLLAGLSGRLVLLPWL